jgi:putative ABC transport system permease protein
MNSNIKFSIRSLMRQKGYTLVNVIGLGLGMALFLLIAVYVYKEFQTDKFHENYNEIHRIETAKYAITASMVANFAREVLPEALEICRIDIGGGKTLANTDEKQLWIETLYYADSSFFNIFSFDLIHGNPATALVNPLSIVLTESESKKFFEDEHPIGKTLMINNDFTVEVTGVMADPVSNSIIKPTALIPFHALPQILRDSAMLNDWNNWNYYSWALLHKNHDINAVNEKFQAGMDKIASERLGFTDVELGFFLRPLSDIYFNKHIPFDGLDKGNLTFILIYISIAVFILFIAVINFINLSTAMAFRRAREVGLKKVMGSTRNMLVRQYLTESVLLSLMALILALVLCEIMVPEFNKLTQSELVFNLYGSPLVIAFIIGFAIVTGLIAGLYPSFYLTRFEPIVVLKGEATKGKRGSLLRKILIVFQFAVSIGIILSTIVIYTQMEYARNKDLGFDRNNIIYFPGKGNIARDFESFKSEMKQIPGVEFVGISSSVPGRVGMGWGRMVDTVERRVSAITLDPECLDVYGFEIIEGRAFDEKMPTDRDNTFILNETAIKRFDLENPIGVRFWNGTVIGVVKDFSYLPVHHSIGPLVLAYMPGGSNYINVKLSGHNLTQTINRIEDVCASFAPDFPFSYSFLDDSIGRLYAKEQRLFRLFLFFSGLAIFVACLGLSGLALFTTQQRTKEIGIRKVFGSSVKGVVLLLTHDFLRWVLIANLIAWPVTWYLMNRWLENFAYHITIQWWMFAMAAFLTLIIALSTISFQAIRAAVANPVEALKYE